MRTVKTEQKTLKQVAKYLNNRYQTHQTAINNDLELKAETTQQFGHYVRLLRTNAGLSRSELAVELNLPEWEIISLENGLVSTIPTHWLHRLAQTFNISVTELSLILGKPIPATPETKLFQFNKNRFSQMLDSFTKVLKSLDVRLVTIGVTSLLLIMTFFPFLWMSDSEIEPNGLIASVPLSNTPTAPIDTGLTYTMEVENTGIRNAESVILNVNIPISYEYDSVGKLIQNTTIKRCSYVNNTNDTSIYLPAILTPPPPPYISGHLVASNRPTKPITFTNTGKMYTSPSLSVRVKPSENIPIRDNMISYTVAITNSGNKEASSVAFFFTLSVTDIDKIELASSNHINVVIPNHLIIYNKMYTIPIYIVPLTIPVIFESAHEVND